MGVDASTGMRKGSRQGLAHAGADSVELVELLVGHCLDLLPVQAAGVLLTDPHGPLRVLAASTDEAGALELLELQSEGGPGLLAYTSRTPVVVPDLSALGDRWSGFVAEARRRGVTSAHAFPIGVYESVIGVLTLFAYEPTDLTQHEQRVAEVLAGMAAVGILNHRAVEEKGELTHQLQGALDSRVVIEQAKGIIAAQLGVDLSAAFEMLRVAARAANRPLAELAADVVAGRVPAPLRRRGSA